MTIDLTSEHEVMEWAIFLPALSTYYVKQYAKFLDTPDAYGKDRWPTTLTNGPEGMNFLNPEGSDYYYKWGLYSAGHAKIKGTDPKNLERMIIDRNRKNCIMIGDSGGYQIITGKVNYDWKNLDEKWDEFRTNTLKWLENNMDWSMTLDVPAVSSDLIFQPKSGIRYFKQTIDMTVDNLHFFMKHRDPKKGKFLNVLSASTKNNSKIWYKRVIDFSNPDKVEEMGYDRNKTLEGYAFGGLNTSNVPLLLARITDLIHDDLIKGKKWMHVLGTARLDWAVLLTDIQRNLRKHYEPEIVVSYDCASPFLANAKGLFYTYNIFNKDKMTYKMESGFDDTRFVGSNMKLPFSGPVFGNLTAGDICVYASPEDHPSGSKTTWDGVSYALAMEHNVYNHITAVQEANRLADMEYTRLQPNYKDWSHDKKRSSVNKISDLIPSNILFFRSFCEAFFDPKMTKRKRYKMISDNLYLLNSLSFAGTKTNNFSDLFEETVSSGDGNDFDTGPRR